MDSSLKIINKKQLRQLVSLSYPTWWRMEKANLAPKRVRLSAGRVGWRLAEVLDWLEKRQAV